MECRRIIVHGVVQGVGFRYHTQLQAQQLGVLGYVRNQPNGTVEILAEGEASPIQALLEWAKVGPASARVSHLDIEVLPAQGTFTTFSIEY